MKSIFYLRVEQEDDIKITLCKYKIFHFLKGINISFQWKGTKILSIPVAL